MKSCLLYETTDRMSDAPYFDAKSIAQDLGLKALFLAAAKEVIYENGQVAKIGKEDSYIQDSMRRVMMIPLRSREEIIFRQEILRDFLQNEELARCLYSVSSEVLSEWNKLGRGVQNKASQISPVAKLISDIRLIELFSKNLKRIREEMTSRQGEIHSRGLKSFYGRLCEAFSDERQAYIEKILNDVAFYCEDPEQDEDQNKVLRPMIVVEYGLEHGLKLSSPKLIEVSSKPQKFYRPGSTMRKLQEFKSSRIPDSFSTVKEQAVKEDAAKFEFGLVNCLIGTLAPFLEEFGGFFDQLHIQSAFYLGAVNLKRHMLRFGLDWCMPRVCEKDCLSFNDLKEFVMCLEQRVDAVGNTCSMEHKMLLIVTGANQGGKSTFLRSVGIAQVMMQSGLMVTAKDFASGIFPDLFTHFTRREDSEMNSGRLDEELKRMNEIIENLGKAPLILLNESFATTTEKEGSVIAYDIIRALREVGVKILTVTHLLSFARKMYQESEKDPNSGVEFFSAERKENGERNFKMIQHAPELTSFGLDLYEEIVVKENVK